MGQATIAPVLWGISWTGRSLWPSREGPVVPADRRAPNETDAGAVASPIQRLKAGESAALGERLEGLRPDLLRLCTRLVGREDAEDATHEVFLRAQTRIDTFDASQPLRRWLLAIGSHHCIDRLRRRATEKLLFLPGDAELHASPTPQPTALDGVLRAQNRTALLTALDQLPDRYRAPLVLRYFAEFDYDAIAAELELTRAQVGTLLFRAKRQLRAYLTADEVGRR